MELHAVPGGNVQPKNGRHKLRDLHIWEVCHSRPYLMYGV